MHAEGVLQGRAMKIVYAGWPDSSGGRMRSLRQAFSLRGQGTLSTPGAAWGYGDQGRWPWQADPRQKCFYGQSPWAGFGGGL